MAGKTPPPQPISVVGAILCKKDGTSEIVTVQTPLPTIYYRHARGPISEFADLERSQAYRLRSTAIPVCYDEQ